MKILITFLFVLSIFSSNLFATEINKSFTYDADKLDVGTLYIYRYSDYDGNEAEDQYLYIKDKEHTILVANGYEHGEALTLQIEKINSKYFMFDEFNYNVLLTSEDSYHSNYSVIYDLKNRKANANFIKVNKGKEKKGVSKWDIKEDVNYPYFRAGNNVSKLNVFLRFLNIEQDELEFGIEDVWANVANYKVIYEKDEVVEGILCRKYKLVTKGVFAKVFNKNGYIWLKKDDPKQILVKYMLNQRIGFTLKNEMAVLKEVKKINYDDFLALVEELKIDIDKGLGF